MLYDVNETPVVSTSIIPLLICRGKGVSEITHDQQILLLVALDTRNSTLR